VVERILADVSEETPETGMSEIVGGDEANLPAKSHLAGRGHLEKMIDVAAASAATPGEVVARIETPALPRESMEAEGTVAHRKGKGVVGLPGKNEVLHTEVGAVDDQGGSGATVATAVAVVAPRLDALDDAGITVAAVVGAAAAPKQSIVTAGDGEDVERRRGVL